MALSIWHALNNSCCMGVAYFDYGTRFSGTLNTEIRLTHSISVTTPELISQNILMNDVIECSPLVKKCYARDARGHIYNQQ